MITAPYNFVPLNEKVFYPPWADDVSHDIPFEDGESGIIDIKITAKSPIFIKDSQDEISFCNHNSQYYIPGSSVKGMIKAISEVLSFSKFGTQDKKLSYRDLNNPSYKKNAMNHDKIFMGWLYKDNDQWKIDSVGKISKSNCRIKYTEMERYIDKTIVKKIRNAKEAYKKYDKVDFLNLNTPKGDIVFTGSVGKEKTREFLFPKNREKTFILDEKVIDTFKKAYYLDTPLESNDWKYLWKERFVSNKEIPVFFQMKDENEIKHFGLSMLYKLPYNYSTMNLVKNYVKNYDEDKLDMIDRIFGYVKDKKALKSRISFSHFKATKIFDNEQTVSLPLSTPRPTFYPNYLVQKGEIKTTSHITYDHKNAILRGHKMYIPKNKEIVEIETKNKKILTKFKPLSKETVFEGKLRFFNLKTEELGLLLLALTILKDEKYYYKLGMAKPYGFGDCYINIQTSLDVQIIIDKYINFINEQMNFNLLTHPRIEALKILSKKTSNQDTEYMNLKEFGFAKKPNNKYVLKEVVKNSYNKKDLNNTLPTNNQIHKVNKEKTKYDKNKSPSANLMDAFNNR